MDIARYNTLDAQFQILAKAPTLWDKTVDERSGKIIHLTGFKRLFAWCARSNEGAFRAISAQLIDCMDEGIQHSQLQERLVQLTARTQSSQGTGWKEQAKELAVTAHFCLQAAQLERGARQLQTLRSRFEQRNSNLATTAILAAIGALRAQIPNPSLVPRTLREEASDIHLLATQMLHVMQEVSSLEENVCVLNEQIHLDCDTMQVEKQLRTLKRQIERKKKALSRRSEPSDIRRSAIAHLHGLSQELAVARAKVEAITVAKTALEHSQNPAAQHLDELLGGLAEAQQAEGRLAQSPLLPTDFCDDLLSHLRESRELAQESLFERWNDQLGKVEAMTNQEQQLAALYEQAALFGEHAHLAGRVGTKDQWEAVQDHLGTLITSTTIDVSSAAETQSTRAKTATDQRTLRKIQTDIVHVQRRTKLLLKAFTAMGSADVATERLVATRHLLASTEAAVQHKIRSAKLREAVEGVKPELDSGAFVSKLGTALRAMQKIANKVSLQSEMAAQISSSETQLQQRVREHLAQLVTDLETRPADDIDRQLGQLAALEKGVASLAQKSPSAVLVSMQQQIQETRTALKQRLNQVFAEDLAALGIESQQAYVLGKPPLKQAIDASRQLAKWRQLAMKHEFTPAQQMQLEDLQLKFDGLYLAAQADLMRLQLEKDLGDRAIVSRLADDPELAKLLHASAATLGRWLTNDQQKLQLVPGDPYTQLLAKYNQIVRQIEKVQQEARALEKETADDLEEATTMFLLLPQIRAGTRYYGRPSAPLASMSASVPLKKQRTQDKAERRAQQQAQRKQGFRNKGK